MMNIRQQPLAMLETSGKRCLLTLVQRGQQRSMVIPRQQALMILDVCNANPEMGIYEAFHFTNTPEFKEKLLGTLLGGLKLELMKSQPQYQQ